MIYPNIETIQGDVGKRHHDFYRCYKCNRLITREEEREVLALADSGITEENKVSICPCKSGKYSPAIPQGKEWKKPQVLRYTLKLMLARAVAPWLEEYEPEGLPHLEWLLGSGLLEKHYKLAWPIVKSVVSQKEKYTMEKPPRSTPAEVRPTIAGAEHVTEEV